MGLPCLSFVSCVGDRFILEASPIWRGKASQKSQTYARLAANKALVLKLTLVSQLVSRVAVAWTEELLCTPATAGVQFVLARPDTTRSVQMVSLVSLSNGSDECGCRTVDRDPELWLDLPMLTSSLILPCPS